MDVFLLIAKYVGFLITSGMAVFSLFFEFTTTPKGSTRKTLTRPGWIALGVTTVSTLTALSAAVVADIRDTRAAKAQAAEQRRLVKEINLSNETLSQLELHVEFDEPIDWRNDNFLSVALSEELYGGWSSSTSLALADWVLNKLPVKRRERREAQAVETRPAVIQEIVKQNQPHLLSNLPTEWLVLADEVYLKNYHPPSALYLDQSVGEQYSRVRFSVDYSPRDQYRYPIRDKRRGLLFTVTFTKRFSEILNSRVNIAFRFRSPNFTQIGPSLFDRQPISEPFVLKHLKSLYLYLDGQLLAEIWRRPDSGRIVARPNSEWDIRNHSYFVRLLDYQLTRDVLLDHFDPARRQAPQ